MTNSKIYIVIILVFVMAEEKIDRFHLDAFGYAQLATESPEIHLDAMQEMYNKILSSNGIRDHVVENAFSQSRSFLKSVTENEKYNKLSDEDKAKEKAPSGVNPELQNTYLAVRRMMDTYTEKRAVMIAGMDAKEVLSYQSYKDGTLPVDVSDGVKELIGKTSGKLGELDYNDPKNVIVAQALDAIDSNKVHGQLASHVRKSITNRQLSLLNGALEAILLKEGEESSKK